MPFVDACAFEVDFLGFCESKAGEGYIHGRLDEGSAQKGNFARAVGVEMCYDGFDAVFLDIKDFMPVFEKTHFKFKLFSF